MGVNKHSGKSMEQIQRENLKRLKKKQMERRKLEKAKQAQKKAARPAEVYQNMSEYAGSSETARVQKTSVSNKKSANPNKQSQSNKRNVHKKKKTSAVLVHKNGLIAAAVVVIVLVLGVGLCVKLFSSGAKEAASENAASSGVDMEASVAETEMLEMEEMLDFSPYCTEETDPSNYVQYTEINVDGTTLSDVSAYQASGEISFGKGSSYASFDGIATFRGNNFRDDPTYGYANMTENTLNDVWSYNTSSLSYNDVWWTGSGWTGQPLMAKWPKETKASMNMYDWAKADDDLVEVIYACMDGYIYFLDKETGKETREPMYLGYTFKGAGALDPRGYPIMYVGAGYDSYNGTARSFIINLLDCSVMYEFGNYDEFSLRGSLSYFDSSALVDAETDTLIYPGENGILYLIKLNTQYDQEAGTLSINPGSIVKWHYWGTRSSTASYWVGMETSAAVYGGYLFVADNGANLMCIDLNTLELVWVQDILDDSNSSPVLSMEDGKLYIYISTSFHLGWRSYNTADVPIWKIDAQTGEIIWQTSYECYSEDALSGGVQSTIALGKNQLSDCIYVTVARTGGFSDGVLACLDKNTGDIKWEHEGFYAWSSPVCVYNEDGTGKVLYCTCGGTMYLLDGLTGELHDSFDMVDGEGAVEASPAVYEDMVVVGTRECKIWGIRLK